MLNYLYGCVKLKLDVKSSFLRDDPSVGTSMKVLLLGMDSPLHGDGHQSEDRG